MKYQLLCNIDSMKKVNLGIVFFITLISTSCGKSPADCVADENADCICTMEYAPVCGCDDVTYSNACAAHCANVEVVSQGGCPE